MLIGCIVKFDDHVAHTYTVVYSSGYLIVLD